MHIGFQVGQGWQASGRAGLNGRSSGQISGAASRGRSAHRYAIFENPVGRVRTPFRARPCLPGAHVGPDHTAPLPTGVGQVADPVAEIALRWLIGHVDTAAFHIVFPAVVHTADSVFLIAPEEQRSAPVRAMVGQYAHPALGIAKRDQILAEQP